MRKIACLALIMLFGWQVSWAQDLLVKGTVTSAEDGLTIPGVSVVEKNTTNGTTTDFDGKYQINVGTDAVLVFSYIGMKTFEVAVGTQTEINVALEADNVAMDEVVVTALGIKKPEKAIGFAVQSIKKDEIVKANVPNMTNALQGRIAGLQVNATSGNAGASSQIIIRGGASIGGNNQPLFVVDGMPIDNSTFNDNALGAVTSDVNLTASRTSDAINRAADIDPEDIESITVLKGPVAAALYGIDAANGAIVITTKKGVAGKGKITYSNNFSIQQVRETPEVQREFMAGDDGENEELENLEHWGPRYPANTTFYDNIDAFFQTGFTQRHNVSVEGGSEKATFRLSAGYLDQEGIVQNNNYDKWNIRLNGSTKLSEKLTLNASANYIKSTSKRAPKGAGSAMISVLHWPANNDMNVWHDEFGNKIQLDETDTGGTDNPLWAVYKNPITDETARIIGNISLSYDPFKWWNILARVGTDYYTTQMSRVYHPQSSGGYKKGGRLTEAITRSELVQTQLFSTFTKDFDNGLNLSLMVGNIVEEKTRDVRSAYGEDFMLENFISINNTDMSSQRSGATLVNRRLSSVLGEFKADYKGFLYLSVTGRNDWSSTLPKKNRSFFYPSVSTSFLFSEVLPKSNIFSYGKIRASYAQVGKDAPAYKTGTKFSPVDRTGGGFAYGYFGGNPELKPETTTSQEFGADLRFFNNRLGLDVNYYKQESKDQITSPRLSYATGFILKTVNGGSIENEGWEIQLSGKPIKTKDFTWNVLINYAQNKGKVTEMPADLDEYYISDTWVFDNVRGGYVLGSSTGALTGFDYERTEDGTLILDANGYPTRVAEWVELGDRTPDFTMGVTNGFSYKGVELSFLVDFRKGGDIYNATNLYMYTRGLSPETVNRGKQVVFDGVVQTNDDNDNPEYAANTKPVELTQSFFDGKFSPANFVEKDINWIRLRNISLSYKLPKNLVKRTPFTAISFSASANNLLMITNYSGVDPDVNALNASSGGIGGVGIDYANIPTPRSFSFGLRVTL